jgi:hypothetical protein
VELRKKKKIRHQRFIAQIVLGGGFWLPPFFLPICQLSGVKSVAYNEVFCKKAGLFKGLPPNPARRGQLLFAALAFGGTSRFGATFAPLNID